MTKLAAAGMLLVLLAPDEGAVRTELEKLRGTWILQTTNYQGAESASARQFHAKLRIEPGKWTYIPDGFPEVMYDNFVIDPTRGPRTVDLPVGQARILGIYKLEGDTLTIAEVPAGEKPRPEKFESPRGSKVTVHVYKRDGKPAVKADDRNAEELKKFQGTWIITSGVFNGDEEAVGGKVVIEGSRYRITRKNGSESSLLGTQGKFTIDPGKTPRQISIDYEYLGMATTDKGIYQLDGDELKVCSHVDERPKAYDSKKGTFRTLLILKRAR